MSSIRMSSPRSAAFVCGTIAACVAVTAPALAAPECRSYGTATYQATRTVDIAGQIQTGTVYVSGDNERDETVARGKPVVHIKSPSQVVSFDPVARKGIIVRPAAKREEPKADATTQLDRKLEGDKQTLIIKKRIGETWTQVYRSVCRTDGVLLERDFFVPGPDGKMLTAKMRHSAIEVKALPADMFKVPADVSLLEPPPPKAQK